MTKKIIICTTFREFNGNAKDRIQRIFLESLKHQSCQDFEVAATVFKERNVESTLKEFGINFRIYKKSTDRYKYSLTDVVLNAVHVAREVNASILIWTTCDVFFTKDFLEILQKKISEKMVATSYPQMVYTTIGDFEARRNCCVFWNGLDTIIIGKDLIYNSKFVEALKRYPNYNWDHFEFLLTAIGLASNLTMRNLWLDTKLVKIENNRIESNESSSCLSESDTQNRRNFEQFLIDNSLKISHSDILLSYKFPFPLGTICNFFFHHRIIKPEDILKKRILQ